MHIRRTTFAALLAAGSLALTACGSSEPAPAAPGGPTEITVSLFGTFGYDEVGLFTEYEAAEPRRHDQLRVDAGRGQVLAGAADPARLRQRRRRRAGHRGRRASPTS